MEPEKIKNKVRNDLPTGYDKDGKCLHPRVLEDGTCDVCGEKVVVDSGGHSMRSTQPPELNYALDFSGKLPVSAQVGMADAINHADPRWVEMAKAQVMAQAQAHPEITVDHVWLAIDRINQQRKRDGLPLYETHNGSAIGPIMTICEGLGYIRGTGRWERSRVAKKRGNLHQVWTSLLYFGGAQ